jgi:DeoR/GlpR family transcriptional regulator of sugar metabolism
MRMPANERRDLILREVVAKGRIGVTELSAILGVTTETVRKDVRELVEVGAVAKRHGYVISASPLAESAFSEKEGVRTQEKAEVARRALDLVPEGGSIFLDTSTTVLALARLLVVRSGLTIATNSIDICQALARSDNDLLVMGGDLRRRSNSCVGAWALAAADQLNVDVAFMGADGASATGPTVRSSRELDLKGRIVRRAGRAAVLMDTSKLSHQGLYTFCDWSEVDALVCERALAEEERDVLPDSLAILPSVDEPRE